MDLPPPTYPAARLRSFWSSWTSAVRVTAPSDTFCARDALTALLTLEPIPIDNSTITAASGTSRIAASFDRIWRFWSIRCPSLSSAGGVSQWVVWFVLAAAQGHARSPVRARVWRARSTPPNERERAAQLGTGDGAPRDD